MSIDPQSAEPLSMQIKKDLRRKISGGEIAVGDKLPSLRKLSTEYGVAELTVHVAIKEMQSEGVLTSVSGRGTFVRAAPTAEADSGDVAAQLESLQAEVRELRTRMEAIESTIQSTDGASAGE
ncbi:hypothetical protein GCM10027174_45760 [Salinifilum aidingensis]